MSTTAENAAAPVPEAEQPVAATEEKTTTTAEVPAAADAEVRIIAAMFHSCGAFVIGPKPP